MASKQTYDQHAFQDSMLRSYLVNSSSDVMALPVCPKCETVGLRTQGYRENRTMRCPKCGYWGTTTKTYGEFIAEVLYG